MMLVNNRFFGRDISNMPQNLSRNQSKQHCEKRTRKQSLSQVQPEKPTMITNQNRMSQRLTESSSDSTLPPLITQNKAYVPEYFTQIFRYMLNRQDSTIGNYCQKTINIDKSLRGEVIDWIIEVHRKYKLFPQTLYFAVHFMDRYLAQKNVQKNKVKLVAMSCIYMASKFEQTYRVPAVKDLLRLCDQSFTKWDILQTEADILKVLNFDLLYDPSYKFLQALEAFSGINKKNFHLAQFMLELALTQSEFLEYSQSLLACSAFYLVCKIRRLQIKWDQKYENLTKYSQSDLHRCARQLCNLLERNEQLSGRHAFAVRVKFKSIQFNEVAKLRLERRK